MLEDKQLVWKLKRGDRDSLSRIYEKYKDNLLTIAALMLGDMAEAEDVLHDVFISLSENVGFFRFYDSLKNYLTASVINRVRERFRKRMYRVVGLGSTGPIKAGSAAPMQISINDEQTRLLAEAFSEVPVEQREAAILHLHGGMKFRQIAALQGVSAGTARGRCRYGVKKLRAVLSKAVSDGFNDVERLIKQTRLTPSAEMDKRILDEASSVLEQSARPVPSYEWIVAGIVTAAVLLVIAVIVVLRLPSSVPSRVRAELVKGQPAPPAGDIEIVKAAPGLEGLAAEPNHPKPSLPADELKDTVEMFNAGNINGLIAVLQRGSLQSKLAAAYFLGRIGDSRAIAPLERLSTAMVLPIRTIPLQPLLHRLRAV